MIKSSTSVASLCSFPRNEISFLRTQDLSLWQAGRDQAFFTRRIGLTDNGAPVPIDYGVKVTGKVGPYNIGFLQVQTRKLGEASTGFGFASTVLVLRVKRDILKRSYIGAILVNRQGATAVGGSSYNRWVARTRSSISLTTTGEGLLDGLRYAGRRSSAGSSRLESIFENDLYRFITVYEDVGARFNPEAGFIERNAIHQYFGQFAYKPRRSLFRTSSRWSLRRRSNITRIARASLPRARLSFRGTQCSRLVRIVLATMKL